MTDPESAVECQPGFGRVTRCLACDHRMTRSMYCAACEPGDDPWSESGEAS